MSDTSSILKRHYASKDLELVLAQIHRVCNILRSSKYCIKLEEYLDRAVEPECNHQMQKFVKVLILTSCIFLAVVKTAGAQIFVDNAIQRTQTYVSVQKDVAPSDDLSKGGLVQKESNLKLNLSAHVLGDINGNTLEFFPPSNKSSFSISIFGDVRSDMPSTIFKPPRLV